MNVSLNTDDQKDEFIARLIYLIHNLRYWQKEKHSDYDLDVIEAIRKWEQRADDYLELIGATEYHSLQELIDGLKANRKIENAQH